MRTQPPRLTHHQLASSMWQVRAFWPSSSTPTCTPPSRRVWQDGGHDRSGHAVGLPLDCVEGRRLRPRLRRDSCYIIWADDMQFAETEGSAQFSLTGYYSRSHRYDGDCATKKHKAWGALGRGSVRPSTPVRRMGGGSSRSRSGSPSDAWVGTISTPPRSPLSRGDGDSARIAWSQRSRDLQQHTLGVGRTVSSGGLR